MHRSWLLTVGFVLASPVSFAQTASADSETLQASPAQIRQLRMDLQTTTVASQRVQIILFRLQLQAGTVARAQQRVDEVHSKLAEARAGVQHFASEVERMERALNETQNPADRKESESLLAARKGQLESQKAAEQDWETKEAESRQELRSEEAKLAALQEQFDQLDKILEQSSRQPAR